MITARWWRSRQSTTNTPRPNGERESLVGEQNRTINQMKAASIRLGIREFNPKLKKAAERLAGLRTAEGEHDPACAISRRARLLAPGVP